MATDLIYKLFDQFLDNIIIYGIEYFNRYYSIYPGVVLDNEDPKKQGRIIAKCPNVTHSDKGLGEWAWPIAPAAGPGFGIFHPPDVGAGVWIQFLNGDPTAPVYSGGWWAIEDTADGGSGELELPAELQPTGDPPVPTKKGWFTTSGLGILFDEDPDNEQVRLQWHRPSDNKYSFLVIDKDGSCQLQNHNGTMLHLNAKEGKEGITLIDKHGNMMASDKDGWKVVQKDGVFVELKKDLVQVVGKAVTVAAESFGVTGGSTLGQGGTEPIPLGNKLLQLWTQAMTVFTAHIHPTSAPGAPTGPPSGAPWPTYPPTTNSQVNKSK